MRRARGIGRCRRRSAAQPWTVSKAAQRGEARRRRALP
jgi:hypothetical protein